jgi:hypothetical protein
MSTVAWDWWPLSTVVRRHQQHVPCIIAVAPASALTEIHLPQNHHHLVFAEINRTMKPICTFDDKPAMMIQTHKIYKCHAGPALLPRALNRPKKTILCLT